MRTTIKDGRARGENHWLGGNQSANIRVVKPRINTR